MPSEPDLKKWAELAETYRGPTNWIHFYDRLLDGIDLAGKRILDVGGGVGVASNYALVKGARSATLLEPEAAGSRSAMLERARKFRGDLGFEKKLTILPTTLQDFDWKGVPFDIAILEASVNHLDEDAVTDMHVNAASWSRYVEIVGKLASLLEPGATIVVSDCARRNFFGDLGLRNPMTPTISWDKHQQPRTWIRLFGECGFAEPEVTWGIHSTLGALGKALLGNGFAFYFLSSYFILTMKYAGHDARSGVRT